MKPKKSTYQEHYDRAKFAAGLKEGDPFHYKAVGYVCVEKHGFGLLIELHQGEDAPHARVFDLDKNPIGAFDITTSRPMKEDDVVSVRHDECGVLTIETKKKIVEWAKTSEYNINRWDFLLDLWGMMEARVNKVHHIG